MTGQDWLEKDFYKELGVSKGANSDEIKKAYRKLARKWHPDQNQGDAAAETKFKDIGEAYAVLSDPEQRKQYDSLRAMAGGGPRFTAGGQPGGAGGFEDMFGGMFGAGRDGGGSAGGAGGGGNFEDILSQMFGGGRGGGGGFRGRQAPVRGADLAAHASLKFRSAASGETLRLTVGGKAMNVRIPAGVRDGQKIRLRGKGEPSPNGGEAGDLVLTVNVEAHPVFTTDGANLRVTVPVTFAEAALGATIEVPTLDGPSVRLKVPAGTPSGRTLRAKGKGLTTSKTTGDLLVTVEVEVPSELDERAKNAVEELRAALGEHDPRARLKEEARK